MKVMLRHGQQQQLLAYVAKKDLEEEITETHTAENGMSILTLANGWKLGLRASFENLRIPCTVEAQRL